MLVSAKSSTVRSRNLAMSPPSDHALIRAVATRRDRQAFEELYRRHERAAFNLAAFLTGQRSLAEEAVQDGMLRVWKHAHTLRDDGNARGWLLRVIARAALKAVANQRRTRDREANEETMEQHASPAVRVQEGAVEKEEALAALRGELHKLSEENRRLVALYFGAGFTQMEISHELELSQTAVSERLRKVLEMLRTRLSAAGFAAAAPLLGAEGLADALHSGGSAPPELGARVFAGLDQATRYSGRVAGSAALSYLALAAVVLVAAAGGAWWVLGGRPVPTEAMRLQEPATSSANAAGETKPLNVKWDYTKGPLPDLRVVVGEGRWEKDQDGGSFAVPQKPGAYVLLPVDLPKEPVLARIKARIDNDGDFYLGGFWAIGQDLIPNKHWNKYNRFQGDPGKGWALDCTIYLLDRYMIVQHQGMTCLIREAGQPYPGNKLLLNSSNVNLLEIELRSLRENEIPESLRDIPACIRAMGSKPMMMDKDGRSFDWTPPQP
ncbi:MAG: sigma-70 family RNA polymerase sigma factor [Planctomycetes bacterium]|nr:sigma-70 family RNA polymerase sigma factor [Planctomycetota bacterium]